jgi:RimJ/RimL family protein N-acetyltransferase
MLGTDLLTGKLVRLAAMDPESAASAWVNWRANSEYARLLDMDPAIVHSVKATRAWVEKHLDDWLAHEFHIHTLEDDRLIGSLGLDGEIKVHGDAFVGIGIGDPAYWGQGYGTDAMKIILRYAFMELNLHRVSLDVFDYNPRAIHSYEKAGFRLEGRQRQMMRREGQRWDVIYMGILRADWEKRFGAEYRLEPDGTGPNK